MTDDPWQLAAVDVAAYLERLGVSARPPGRDALDELLELLGSRRLGPLPQAIALARRAVRLRLHARLARLPRGEVARVGDVVEDGEIDVDPAEALDCRCRELVMRRGFTRVAANRERLAALWSAEFRARTGSLWLVWFCVNFSYYGAFIWIPTILVSQGYDLVRSFGFTLIITLAQLPGYAVAAWLMIDGAVPARAPPVKSSASRR